MPSKKELLAKDVEMRWQILVVTKEILKFAHYFENPETPEEHNYINRHRHLIFIKWSLRRLMIIELSKLFSDSDNQKFNLQKLIRKMDSAGEYRSLKCDTEVLKEWSDGLALLSNPITELNRLRNKFYAHTEGSAFEPIETTLTFELCYELIAFAEDVIRGLAGRFLNRDFIVLTPYFQSNSFDFIKILVATERAGLEQIAKDNSMTIEQLLAIANIMEMTDFVRKDRIFSKENLTWKQLQFIKKNLSEPDFVTWLRENYDFLMCYHGGRPVDVSLDYSNGFVPANFEKAVERFEKLLSDIGYQRPYDIQHVLDTYRGQTDRFIYFILDKEDFIDGAPHYLIYGSELLLSLAQNVASFIKDHLKETGVPTIFHCKIPLDQIDDAELKGLHERILVYTGNLNQRLNQIFSNYSIIMEKHVSANYIINHEHPTGLLIDYHAHGSYYRNTIAFCDVCKPTL